MQLIRKYFYILGEFIRNKHIRSHLKALQESDFYERKQLEEIQVIRLRNLLNHAKKNSPFHAKRLAKIDIDTITLQNLDTLPILYKTELMANMKEIQNYPQGEKMFMSATSASTGDALKFERNEHWDASHRAAIMRGYSWYGVYPWMRNLYFWGFNPHWKLKLKMRFFDFLLNRYRLFHYDEKTLKKAAKYLKKCDYLEGYSSSIFTLSQYLEKNGYHFENIKMVKGTSEKIYDYYHKPVEKVFNKKIISEYGSAEGAIMAFECPEGHMHVVMENVIIEEVDNKLVITNLFSHAVPIIRYELGDYIKLDKTTQCQCGREHEIIQEVTGRLGYKVYGYKEIYPTLTIYYIFKNVALQNNVTIGYFGTQHEKGVLNFKIMYDGDRQDEILGFIRDQGEKLYGDDIKIDITFVSGIEHRNRKAHAFESFIDLESKLDKK